MSSLFSRMLVLLFLIVILCLSAEAEEGDERRAMRAFQKAAMSYPLVKGTIKNVEHRFFKLVPIEKTDLVYLSPLAAIIDGRISTTKFKNLVYKTDGLVVDPDITYAFTEDIWLATFNVTYTF